MPCGQRRRPRTDAVGIVGDVQRHHYDGEVAAAVAAIHHESAHPRRRQDRDHRQLRNLTPEERSELMPARWQLGAVDDADELGLKFARSLGLASPSDSKATIPATARVIG